jgi:mannose-1-phosphate guanylyltransferase/mannose-6-phosphate isomerase
MPERIAIVMAGGGGTRLWPASTELRPKQLVDPTLAPTGRSLLQATFERVRHLVQPDDVWVVTTALQRSGIADSAPSVHSGRILVEPRGRNTAPCIALALRVLLAARRDGPPPTVIVVPADHFVRDEPAMTRHLEAACLAAERHHRIVTLGIAPTRPDTGYGYIERDAALVEDISGISAHAVRRFVEKPDEARARDFLAAGTFLWNAGIFVMPLDVAAAAFARHAARTWEALEQVEAAVRDGDEQGVAHAIARAYESVEPAPVDVAVMEKLDDLLVVPADVGWTDLGSWQAVASVLAADPRGNRCAQATGAHSVVLDCDDTLVWNQDATVAVVGLRDIAVIAVGGRVLVCPLSRAQEVREVVAALAASAAPRDQKR